MKDEIIKNLHKFFFPSYHRALVKAMDISWTYWQKSPSYPKQEVGEDIYNQILRSFK